jgi:uncharacterized membrane protein YfcA
MILGLPAGELAMLLGFLIAGGLLTGVLSGLFGVGGGGILVPVLYEVFGAFGVPEDVRMHMAVGTSFAIIIPTSFRAAGSHYERGAIDIAVLRLLAPAAIIGVVLGAIAASFANDAAMKAVWVISAITLSATLLLKRENWRLQGEIERPAVVIPVGAGVGFLATLMGVGGGAQITAILTLFGRSMLKAVGTAAGFSCIVAVPALIGFIWAGWGAAGLPPGSAGYVSVIGAAAMIPSSVLAAPIGVRLAHGLPRRKLEVAFAIFLIAVASRFLLALVL